METKSCSKCGEEKALTEFWKTIGGYDPACKKCRMLRRYNQNRENRKASGKKIQTLTTREVQELRSQGLRYCPHCKRILNLEEFSHCRGGKNNSPHCLECNREFQKKRNLTEEAKIKHREYYQKRKESQKNAKLLRQYGISLEKYRETLDSQNGKCIICGKSETENGKMLAVDHDHKTGKVRGLLCNNCNVAVGFMQDDPSLALKINQYLVERS